MLAIKIKSQKILLPLLFLMLLSGCASVENGLFKMGLGVERSMAGFEKKDIQLSDHHWTYLEAGEPGQPVVLLLHGFGGDKDNWTRMVQKLDGYHVYAPDLPGHGDSSFDEKQYYGFDVQSLRLAEFVDALHLNKFHLVGNSMGGAIAALYAYRHPEQVTSLALIDAVGFYGDKPSELEEILARHEKNPLIVKEPEDFDALMDFVMSEQPFLPWPARSVLARKAVAREAANEHIFEHIHKEAEAAKYAGGFGFMFKKLSMPVYVIWGENDRVLSVTSVPKFVETIPHVQADIIPGIGHVPMLEIPKKTAQMLTAFWQQHESSGAIASHE